VKQVRFVNSPEEHMRRAQFSGWYSLLDDLTPRSVWFAEIPGARQIEQEFRWPVFVKGMRQTSRRQQDGYESACRLLSEPERL
jgi:hypothetical protein